MTTFAFGTKGLDDFLHEIRSSSSLPVDIVNNPHAIAEEDGFVSINATTEVASWGDVRPSRRYSGSQADFAKRAVYSPHESALLLLRSTAGGEVLSVTRYGVAEVHSRSISPRANALIAIAHPQFWDKRASQARALDSL